MTDFNWCLLVWILKTLDVSWTCRCRGHLCTRSALASSQNSFCCACLCFGLQLFGCFLFGLLRWSYIAELRLAVDQYIKVVIQSYNHSPLEAKERSRCFQTTTAHLLCLLEGETHSYQQSGWGRTQEKGAGEVCKGAGKCTFYSFWVRNENTDRIDFFLCICGSQLLDQFGQQMAAC